MMQSLRLMLAACLLLLPLFGPAGAAGEGGLLAELANNSVARQSLDRSFELVKPEAVESDSKSDTRFQPVADSSETLDRLAQAYPAAARPEAVRVFTRLLELYPQVEQRHRIPSNDVAGAVATFIAGAYTGYSGIEVEDEQFRAIVEQMRRSLGARPEFAAASARDKQNAYEQLAILGLLTLSTHEGLKGNPRVPNAAQIRANLRAASKGYLESLIGIDADRVRVGSEGVTLAKPTAPAATAVPAAATATPTAASGRAIEAVLLRTSYSFTGVAGGVSLKYKPAVLYADGSYSEDAQRALQSDASIDGRWIRQGSGWLLTDRQGKQTSIKESMRAEPAQPGQTLAGSYRSLSGAGPDNSGVPVVAAWSQMQFSADGRVLMGQGAGADAGNVVTRSSQTRPATYRLDGYRITIRFDTGPQESRLFYFLPGDPGRQAIAVGDSTLSQRR